MQCTNAMAAARSTRAKNKIASQHTRLIALTKKKHINEKGEKNKEKNNWTKKGKQDDTTHAKNEGSTTDNRQPATSVCVKKKSLNILPLS